MRLLGHQGAEPHHLGRVVQALLHEVPDELHLPSLTNQLVRHPTKIQHGAPGLAALEVAGLAHGARHGFLGTGVKRWVAHGEGKPLGRCNDASKFPLCMGLVTAFQLALKLGVGGQNRSA